jgi:hypothetical protein
MDNFKVKKAYGVNWLKNATDKGGASQMVINSKNNNNLVVALHNQQYGRMWADVTKEELKSLIKYDVYLCELITSYPHKVYFDIDKKPEDITNKNEYMNNIINKINSIFPNSDMAVSGSETNKKYSYHITLNNYIVSNKEERTKLNNIVSHLNESFDDGFDVKVYTNNRQMKTINQTKKDDPPDRKQLKIINDNDEKHFITAFFNIDNVKTLTETILPNDINDKLKEIENKKPLDLGTLPKLKINKLELKTINEHLVINDEITPQYLLSITPLNSTFQHKYTFFVSLFCYFNDVSLDAFIEWYKQKTTDQTKINKKINEWDTLNRFQPVDIEMFKNMLSVYYPALKTSKYLLHLENMFNLEKYKTNIKHIETITQEHFNINDKYIIFNIGMGGGKTEQTINYLSENKNKTFLIVAPNQSLSFNTYTRLKRAGLELEHYNIEYANKKTVKIKHKSEMKNAKNLICCVNSLHYLDTNTFDFIILDELETLNNKWYANKTMKKQLDRSVESWDKYISLCKEAEKVIILDAFITSQSLHFINNIIQINETMIIYKRPFEVSEREINILSNINMTFNCVLEKLNNNKRVLIYYPYKNGDKQNCSMKYIEEYINKNVAGKKGCIYNADVDDEKKQELKDVNKYWKTYDFVIMNSLVGVGINFDVVNYFDCCILCLAGFSSPRDVLQASCRPRHIASNKIYVSFLSCRNTNDVLLNTEKLMNDDKTYNDLVNDLKIEKMAPIKGSFYLFCKKAGYKIKVNSKLMENENKQDVENLIDGKRLIYSYDTIDDINHLEADEIQNKINEHRATAEDKMKLRKYFFTKKFVIKQKPETQPPTETQTQEDQEQTDKEILIEAWNNNFNFFFEQLENLAPSTIKTNILEQIKRVNNWSSILPDENELKNMKLDEALINELFIDENKAFFLRLNKDSGHKTIIKTIYNNVFKMNVMNSKADKSKHSKINIDDIYYKMLNFGIRTLKVYQQPNNRTFIEPIKKYEYDKNSTINSLDKGIDVFDDDE